MPNLETLLGAAGAKIATWAIALVAVIILIVVFLRLLKAILGNRLNMSERNNARGRAPRLGVTEYFNLDKQGRRLVVVRRDNVEHLLLIGGPNDVVVESNIVRGERASLPRIGGDPRETAGKDSTKELPLPDLDAPRAEAVSENRAKGFGGIRRPDPEADRLPVPAPLPEPVRPEPVRVEPVRVEPVPPPPSMRMPPPPPVMPTTPAAPREQRPEPSTEMSQRLEAVLRKPYSPPPAPEQVPPRAAEPRLPEPKPAEIKPAAPEPKAPESKNPESSPPESKPAESAPAIEKPVETKPVVPPVAPQAPVAAAPAAATPVAPPPQVPPPQVPPAPLQSAPVQPAPVANPSSPDADKNPFDSLEAEMAKLLGRGLGDKP